MLDIFDASHYETSHDFDSNEVYWEDQVLYWEVDMMLLSVVF